MPGLVCCAGPLLVLAVFLLLPGRKAPGPHGSRTPTWSGLRISIGVCVLVLCILVTLLCEPFVRPDRYLASVEEHGAPLIAAIDAYDAKHGSPPTSLRQLVPEFIPSIPESGFRGNREWSYEYVSSITEPRWRLSVWTGGYMIDDTSCFYFDSWSRRFGYSPR